jgi:hypothetical protein
MPQKEGFMARHGAAWRGMDGAGMPAGFPLATRSFHAVPAEFVLDNEASLSVTFRNYSKVSQPAMA